MDKLIIAFDGKNQSEVDGGGIFSFIGFERLRKLLETDCGCGKSEKITGLVIRNDGISIRLESITPIPNP